jgi:hypothetical protein
MKINKGLSNGEQTKENRVEVIEYNYKEKRKPTSDEFNSTNTGLAPAVRRVI